MAPNRSKNSRTKNATATCKAAGRENVGEQTADRVENQQYIHYQKGAMVLYRLKTEIGAEKLNRALNSSSNATPKPPYPRSTDFLLSCAPKPAPNTRA